MGKTYITETRSWLNENGTYDGSSNEPPVIRESIPYQNLHNLKQVLGFEMLCDLCLPASVQNKACICRDQTNTVFKLTGCGPVMKEYRIVKIDDNGRKYIQLEGEEDYD